MPKKKDRSPPILKSPEKTVEKGALPTGIKAASGSYSGHSTADYPASNRYLNFILSSNEEKFNTFHA